MCYVQQPFLYYRIGCLGSVELWRADIDLATTAVRAIRRVKHVE